MPGHRPLAVHVDSYDRLIRHINRKDWWHVPPVDPNAYRKRGKFLASSFREAEFWGRPLDEPQRVRVITPLVGDEETMETELFGKRLSSDDMSMEQRWALDAKMKNTALAKSYDSIVLMTAKGFADFINAKKLPRSFELNILS